MTKAKRTTDTLGAVHTITELDPWGGETNRSYWSGLQPHKYTTYERDANGSDEAMHRRYNRWWSKFDQPDPYDGSYNLTDPQSFNRYSYVGNDPVNFVDPTGLMCYNIIRTDYYSDTGQVIGSFIVGNYCDDWSGIDIGNFGVDVTADPEELNDVQQSPATELQIFLANNIECARLLSRKLGKIELFSFVDTRAHPGILDKTLDELGVYGSTTTLRDALVSNNATTVIGRATAYLSSSHFSQQPNDRGVTLFHEIFVHYASGAYGHVAVAASLGLKYEIPKPPNTSPSPRFDERTFENLKYRLEIDTAASGALDAWIRRGCK